MKKISPFVAVTKQNTYTVGLDICLIETIPILENPILFTFCRGALVKNTILEGKGGGGKKFKLFLAHFS